MSAPPFLPTRKYSFGEEQFSNIAQAPSIDSPWTHHSDRGYGGPRFSPPRHARSYSVADSEHQRPISRPAIADSEPYQSEEEQQFDDLSNVPKPSCEAGMVSFKPNCFISNCRNQLLIPKLDTEIDNLEYTRASDVNVSNFLSVKLCGKSNYLIWKAQMECLMKCHKMLGIVNDKYDWPGTKSEKIIKQYENLLNGWIIGSLNEEIFKDDRIYEKGTKDIWKTLEQIYNPLATPIGSARLICDGKNKTRGISNYPNVKELHDATIEGHWWKIKSILKNNKGAAKLVMNDDGDTLLHLAVRRGKNNFIKELLNFIGDGEIENRNSEGHTALHIAAIVGNKDAAELLVEKRKELLEIKDLKLNIPVRSAYVSNQVNAFVYLWEAMKDKDLCSEEYYFVFDINSNEKLLRTVMFKKQYGLAKKLVNIIPGLANTPSTFFEFTRSFPSDIGFGESLIYPSLNNGGSKIVKRSSLLFHSLEYMYTKAGDTLWEMRSPSSCNISNLSAHVSPHISASFPLFYIVFPPVEVAPINNIQKKRKAYREAKVFLKWICDKNRHLDDNENQNPALDKFYRGSLMEAVRLDVPEVLNQIMDISSKALDFKETDGYNIIQLAVINRSPKVYNLIHPIIERKEDYRSMEDHWRNNLLHLAGRLAPLTVLSCTTGAALQLQRELQWRKQVEKLMEPAQLTAENLDCETPEKVFSREHENLVKDGEKWIKTTAESCSITAALIITIVFAAAITVPGGSNQETGIPLFKKKIAFNVFAVADAVSLFSASTSLLVFLSILTTRFAEKDFLISLPRRLFVGLCLLFLSTTAMMFAFSAILFLVFCDERPWMLAPIGGLTCLPIAAIVTLQLPLVIDLYQAIYIPIFGKDEKEEKVQTLFEAEDKKENGKFRNILRNINPVLRRRTACCLPVRRTLYAMVKTNTTASGQLTPMSRSVHDAYIEGHLVEN
ncbi:Ankyrin repeat-containing protein [Artemisia annua]|uniref:Ankyrin repeat-containing protein n=1 Tax=Artemisia annua TaxID=35608 RepID=A0A2U1NT24_ARTAN|nr:Ankyrin repeat-containing protein [Artemisia annua]